MSAVVLDRERAPPSADRRRRTARWWSPSTVRPCASASTGDRCWCQRRVRDGRASGRRQTSPYPTPRVQGCRGSRSVSPVRAPERALLLLDQALSCRNDASPVPHPAPHRRSHQDADQPSTSPRRPTQRIRTGRVSRSSTHVTAFWTPIGRILAGCSSPGTKRSPHSSPSTPAALPATWSPSSAGCGHRHGPTERAGKSW